MKVYCRNCKFFFEDNYTEPECNVKNNVTLSDEYYGIVKDTIQTPSVKNADNNCQDYKPDMWHKIRTFLGYTLVHKY